jgi:two-component system, NarL family, response regulator NreC
MIRVLLADDHAVLRAGLRVLIEGEADMQVVAEAADGDAAVLQAVASQPDVALVDLSMPGSAGVDAVGRITSRAPGIRVIVLTMHDHPAFAEAALAAGAAAYVVKDVDAEELFKAIRIVHEGGTVVRLSAAMSRAPARVSRSRDVWRGQRTLS